VLALAWPALCRAAGDFKDCGAVQHSDHPHARLSNGLMDVFVFLPEKHEGYYRSSRFDWSGIVACATYKGHSYFGEWFDHYDPMAHDAVTGPVEEFRGVPSEPGYDEAHAGGFFVKIGVGVLRKTTDAPYDFKIVYPVVDPGEWTVKTSRLSIIFEQKLSSPLGISYVYRKILRLETGAPVLHIEHRLRNTGSAPIHTDAYDHDFFMLDHKTTGPDTKITFPFQPVFDSPLPAAARVEGNVIHFQRELHRGEVVRGGDFKGFNAGARDYVIRTENTATGAGVLQSSSSAMDHAFFWATDKTVCPEAFIAVNVDPKQNVEWSLRYQFLAESPAQ
jgi:hypothetical protein